ncbi:MAG: EAL domain-containing protein, partial [Oscillospiraceae bacterium]
NYIPPITSYIDHAYLAARTIKNSHRSSFAVYDTAMLESLNHEKELENIMDNAIRNHEFKVYMQPRIDLATQRVAGSEALVRWQLPDDTMIMPDSFIPLFEKNGFIESVDFYMLTSVCEQIRERLDANEVCLPVSINQSRFLFYQKDYFANVCEILERYNVPTSFIELEITESLFLDPNEDFVNILNALRAKGISISLDDFGSGYSSLNMLRNIPLDIIKIDRDFLRVSDESNTNRILIRKIVELASELNIKVVCEGVETEEQMHFLESIGCDYAQGFYYSRPIPCEQFIEFTNNFNK